MTASAKAGPWRASGRCWKRAPDFDDLEHPPLEIRGAYPEVASHSSLFFRYLAEREADIGVMKMDVYAAAGGKTVPAAAIHQANRLSKPDQRKIREGETAARPAAPIFSAHDQQQSRKRKTGGKKAFRLFFMHSGANRPKDGALRPVRAIKGGSPRLLHAQRPYFKKETG